MNTQMNTKSDYYIPCVNEFSIEKNPYSSIMVDITQRCNLKCNVCFNPVHSKRFDMDIDYFEQVCERLPRGVSFKLLGGEPTMHPKFFDFMRIANKHGHHSYFSSNGLRFLEDDFMEELASLPFSVSTGITIDGGLTNREAYEVIDGRDLLDTKLAALAQLERYNIKRVVLSAIIVRDLNEEVIGQLFDLSERNTNIRYIMIRNVGKGGQWIDTVPYKTEELKQLCSNYFDQEQLKLSSHYGEICEPPSTNTCCYRFRPSKRVQVALIESIDEDAVDCPYKGKLIDERFVIQSFHESLIKTGNKMAVDYGIQDIKVRVE